jgi:hypothetical protein
MSLRPNNRRQTWNIPLQAQIERQFWIMVQRCIRIKKCLQHTINAPARMKSVIWRFQRRVHDLSAILANMMSLDKVAKTGLHVLPQETPYNFLVCLQCLSECWRLLFQYINFLDVHAPSISYGEVAE